MARSHRLAISPSRRAAAPWSSSLRHPRSRRSVARRRAPWIAGRGAARGRRDQRLPRPSAVNAVTALTAIGALIFTGLSFNSSQEQNRVAQDNALVARYNTALGQLGAASIEERLGAIYVLQRLAVDSSRDSATIYDVLAGFIRSRSSITVADGGATACGARPALDPDIQAALDAVGRRRSATITLEGPINMRETCLTRARIVGGDYRGIDFSGAILHAATITG